MFIHFGPPRRFILATGIAALLGGSLAQPGDASAATITKENNTDNLNLNSSWVGGLVPGATDVALWSSNVTTTNSVLLGANLTWAGVQITNPAGPVTIGTGNTLTLLASGIDMTTATQNFTINAGLALGVGQTWNLGTSGRTLTVGGIVSGAGPLTIQGTGNVLLSGVNTFNGQTTIGSGSFVSISNGAALGFSGGGNETIVSPGGTLNLGAQTTGTERFQIAGTGVNGIGALINQAPSTTAVNAPQFVALTADATINNGGSLPASFNAAGTSVAGATGRFDIRLSAYTAGAKNLDLNGNTLTKIGSAQLGLIAADVTAGNIVINSGTLSIESTTVLNGAGTIRVNPNGKLAFFSLAASATNVAWPITVNGGTIGDSLNTSAAQTMPAPITITGSTNPNFSAVSGNGTTFSGVITKDPTSTVTEIAKRGAGLLALTNTGNSFDVPVKIYQGTLRADFANGLGVAGGVSPAAPLTSTDTPLGTSGTITLAGGTLAIRANMANDATNQQFDLQRNVIVDLAPGAMTFDRVSNTAQTDKNLIIQQLTFAAPSAANGWVIGQNQFTFSQANTHRLQLPSVTINNDTVFSNGDLTFTGDISSAGANTVLRTGGNTVQFVGSGANGSSFGAFINLGTGSIRVGTGFGTPQTSSTVTLGTGRIYLAPGSGISFRNPTNIAPNQIIEVLSQRAAQGSLNLELFTGLPSGFRAVTSGVLALGNATGFGDVDLSRLGDGTFRLGSNISAAGNGTITGVISPGAGGVVRVGAAGVLTVSGTDRIAGNTSLEVGSPLVNGGFNTQVNGAAQNGTVLLTGPNNYTGTTTINRASVLRFQTSLPATGVTSFGTATAEGAAGTFINGAANIPLTLNGGGSIRFDSSALTTAVDTDRWLDTAPVPLYNGTLQLDARNNTSTTNETVGNSTLR